ncbi:MAG TPA: CPBP family intramembrane glutamic endopeptidase [Rhizomicrobium sp.]|nr:CPBP family intramembrane glutamic endopeptidase [Rhizomicrobium sp.]
MNLKYLRPAIGVAAAIAITATMDATGLSAFSALPLFPLLVALWFWERDSRYSVGFVWGTARGYFLAVLYPVLVIGALVFIAAAAGKIDTTHTLWSRSLRNLVMMSVATILVAIVTEEGFFRGWLWASLSRAGFGAATVLVLSSLAFSLWHASFAVLDAGLDPASAQIPIYLLNAAIIGAVWGLLRWISGSVIVSSVSHGIWNGLTYILFGVGTRPGALGIAKAAMFGPETGILGLALNFVFAAALFVWWRNAQKATAQ